MLKRVCALGELLLLYTGLADIDSVDRCVDYHAYR